MELTQSWLVTMSRYHFTTYEQKILLAVIDGCQEYFRKKYLKALMKMPPVKPKNDKLVTIKMASLLESGDNHYSRLKAAVRSLQSKTMEFYHPDTRTWESSPLLLLVRHRQRSGELQVTVPVMFLRALYDMRMGYSKYDLEQALTLPSPYAIRMFSIVAHQSRPIEMRVDTLKSMFGVASKYSQTRDFLKRCIDPCMIILTQAHLPSFKYEKITDGRKVVALRFFRIEPERVIANESNVNAKDLKSMLGDELTEMLIYRVGFTWRELQIHSALIRKSLTLPNYIQVYRDIVHRWYKYNKNKGYIIAALKSECR